MYVWKYTIILLNDTGLNDTSLLYAHALSALRNMADTGWPGCAKNLKGVILDLCGVLYDSGEGGGVAIPGSIEAVKKWVIRCWLDVDAVCTAVKSMWCKVHGPGICCVDNMMAANYHVHIALKPLMHIWTMWKWLIFVLVCPHLSVARLKASDLQLRFCTNETQATREKFVAKLQRLGFDISVSEVFPPAPAAIAVLKERGLRPHLLVHDGKDFLIVPPDNIQH